MPGNTTKRIESSRFNLISWFSFFGMLAIAIISVITSLVLANFLEEHLLRRDAAVMRDFVDRIARHHDPRIYFSPTYDRTGDTLNDFFLDISHMPDVARINAFARDGTIVWSSDRAMIGQRFADNHELAEALAGELVYEKGSIAEKTKPEHVPFAIKTDLFVENYIPLRDDDIDKIVGVVEIYRIPEALATSISDGRKLVWISLSVGGLFLFLTLFGIMSRGQRLIETQQQDLFKQTRLATIGEMASSVAHSIRNPIASIRSSAELALDELNQPELQESLEDIVVEVDRFDGWIRELLTFTSEAGDANATVDIAQPIMASVGAQEKRALRQQVLIVATSVKPGIGTRGDLALLTQVFNSLVANALDAMPQGGKIVLDTATAGNMARISISDTGFGIPADRLQHLFDPLVTHKQGGLGIGLALARQIVKRYGGTIDISSTVGAGTTVVIELPTSGGKR